jgi:VWFA-related protein
MEVSTMSKWFLLPCLAGWAIAQTASPVQPTFRVGTRLVQLDVVVLNDKTPVRGLTKDDFTVQDKGKPQTIAIFSVAEAHKAPKANPLPPNVSSNRMNNRGESTSTATVILFDKMNTPSADQVVARRQTLALLSTLTQTDRVAFYSLDTDLTLVQDFTDGAERLASAAKSLSAQSTDAAPPAAGSPDDQALLSALRNSLTAFQQAVDGSTRVASTMTAFRTIVRHLDGLPGRKNLIWLTASIPFTYGVGAERRKDDQVEIDRMERLMSEANLAVYAVDPRGAGAGDVLSTNGRKNAAGVASQGGAVPGTDGSSKSSSSNSGGGRGGRGGGGGNSTFADTSSTNGPYLGTAAGQATDSAPNTLAGTQGMQVISDNTGGKAYYNTNDLAGAVREILDTTEVSYTLGFYVDEKALDNKNHDLSVKLTRKPETSKASLHYRKSYAALNAQTLAAQEPHPAIGVLAADALDASAIGVMAATAPSPKNPGLHVVQVRVDLADLTLERKGDKWTGAFDLGLAMQGSGKQLSSDVSVKTIPLSLSDDQLKQGLTAGLVIDNTVPSPTQPMRLRVVVQDKTSGAGGSVRLPIAPR